MCGSMVDIQSATAKIRRLGGASMRPHLIRFLRPMSHLRQSRATLMRDPLSLVKVASMTGRVARCVMARRTVARLVFEIERCSRPILCDFDARQSRALKTRDKIAGVTSVFGLFGCSDVITDVNAHVIQLSQTHTHTRTHTHTHTRARARTGRDVMLWRVQSSRS